MTSVASHDHIVVNCLAVDLEVGRRDRRIHAFAAGRADTGERLFFRRGDLPAALDELDAFVDGAEYPLGHNLIACDRPHLQAVRPDLRLLQLPQIDTLRLNPLAFSRNPYHGVVKHYHDGQPEARPGERPRTGRAPRAAGVRRAADRPQDSRARSAGGLALVDDVSAGRGRVRGRLRRRARRAQAE